MKGGNKRRGDFFPSLLGEGEEKKKEVRRVFSLLLTS